MCNLSQLKQIVNIGMKVQLLSIHKVRYVYLCVTLVLQFLIISYDKFSFKIECTCMLLFLYCIACLQYNLLISV